MAPFKNDFTITTLSSSVREYSTETGEIQVPYRFGNPLGTLNLRETDLPYAPMANPDSSFIWKKIDHHIPPSLDKSFDMLHIASEASVPNPNYTTSLDVLMDLLDSTAVARTPGTLMGGITSSLTHIASVATAHTPTALSESILYTHVLNATNSAGTTAKYIGSLYLEAQTYAVFGAMINELKYGGGDKTTFIEFKSFANGSQLTALSAIGAATHKNAEKANVIVSNEGWYDIYMSSSGTGVTNTTSSIKGVYYQY